MDVKKLIEEVLIDLGNNKSLTDVSSKIQIIVRLLGDDKLRKWYNCEFVTGYKVTMFAVGNTKPPIGDSP